MKLCEAGHTLLYTVVFIPIVLGGAALAFDVSGLNLRAERLQSKLDTIALDAAHLLPDIELTKGRALSKLHELEEEFVHYKVEVNSLHSRVSVEVTFTENNLILPKLLDAAGIPAQPQSQRLLAEAELLPVDVSIVLSDGVDQRPWQEGLIKFPWPTENSLGDVSSALSSCLSPPSPRYSTSDLTELWSNSKEWLTQSCFNPIFSNFKLSTMNIAASLLAVGSNRVAVIFTPSSNGLGEVLRHAVGNLPSDGIPSGYLKTGEVPKASWRPSKDLDYELGDEACIVFSDPTTAHEGEYSLERVTNSSSTQRGCLNPVLNSKCGLPFSIGEGDRLDHNCLKQSSLAESIYWRSAKRPVNNFDAVPDIYTALGVALSEVSPNVEQMKQDRELRGHLADAPGRAIIVLTSILPALDLTNPAVQGLIKTETSLIIGFLERPEYQSDIVDSKAQVIRVREWQSFLAGSDISGRIKSGVIVAQSPSELSTTILPKIISATRKVLLRK